MRTMIMIGVAALTFPIAALAVPPSVVAPPAMHAKVKVVRIPHDTEHVEKCEGGQVQSALAVDKDGIAAPLDFLDAANNTIKDSWAEAVAVKVGKHGTEVRLALICGG